MRCHDPALELRHDGCGAEAERSVRAAAVAEPPSNAAPLLQVNMFCDAGRAAPTAATTARLREVDARLKLSERGGSVCVVQPSVVRRQLAVWRSVMSPIEPRYAMKALPDPRVCELFDGFDCASLAEIELVLELGKRPSDIIFANTAKRPGDLLAAAALGVDLVTVDNEEECEKVLRLHPRCGVVLRLSVDDAGAQHTTFSHKFGAAGFGEARRLVDSLARSRSLRGFSFHVGSGQTNGDAWHRAMQQVDALFAYLRQTYPEELYDLASIIDVGGGYSSDARAVPLTDVRRSLEPWLVKYAEKRWLAEPGRWFAADAVSLLCAVIGRSWRGPHKRQYVLANGVHQTFSCVVFDRKPRELSDEDWLLLCDEDGPPPQCVRGAVVGETCDGADVVYEGLVPRDLPLGTLLYFPCMGAYANASANHFNGFAPPGVVYFEEET